MNSIDFFSTPNFKNLTLIDTSKMSKPEWLAARYEAGIGGSDVATIMGKNKYKASAQLFMEKIGLMDDSVTENEAMFWGTVHEPNIVKYWQYHDGSPSGYIDNFRNGDMIRKAWNVSAIIKNPLYPWLAANIDAGFVHDGLAAPLECKTISGHAADMWTNKIPPMYLIQLHTYMVVLTAEYGEIATLRDGNQFEVLPFDMSSSIADSILGETKSFYDKVLTGRKIVSDWKETIKSVKDPITLNALRDEMLARVNEYLPKPDGSSAYSEYLKSRFKEDNGVALDAQPEHYDIVREMLDLQNRQEQLKTELELRKNILKTHMQEAQVLQFGADGGRIVWRTDARGVRSFHWDKVRIS